MTTETMATEVRTMEAVQKELDASIKELAKLQSEAQAKVTEIMADIPNRPDWTEQIKLAAIPATNMQDRIDRLTKELAKLKSASRWESSQAIRQPVIDMFKTILIDNPPSVRLASVRGTIDIKDGKAVVTLKPVFSTFDIEGLQQLIASEVDVKAFSAAELTSMDIAITDIGTDNKINLVPRGEGLKPASSGITRSKSQEYEVNGKWYPVKDYLKYLLDSGDPEAAKRSKFYLNASTTGSGAAPEAAKRAAELGHNHRDAAVQRVRKNK